MTDEASNRPYHRMAEENQRADLAKRNAESVEGARIMSDLVTVLVLKMLEELKTRLRGGETETEVLRSVYFYDFDKCDVEQVNRVIAPDFRAEIEWRELSVCLAGVAYHRRHRLPALYQDPAVVGWHAATVKPTREPDRWEREKLANEDRVARVRVVEEWKHQQTLALLAAHRRR